MGYVIAYLLLTVVVDLLLELVEPADRRPTSIAIHRRLWNENGFDCCSRMFSMDGGMSRKGIQGTKRCRLKRAPSVIASGTC